MEELDRDGARVVIFWTMQGTCYNGFLVSTCIFLLCRFFLRHKPSPEHWGSGTMLETEESLIAFKELNYMVINGITPLVMTMTLEKEEFPDRPPNETILLQFEFVAIMSKASFVITFFLVFIDYKSGINAWKVTAPYLYIVLTLTGFVILPLVNIGWSVYTIYVVDINAHGGYLMIFIAFYAVFCATLVMTYFTTYKARFLNEVLLYLQLKRAMKAPDFEEHKEDILGDTTNMTLI